MYIVGMIVGNIVGLVVELGVGEIVDQGYHVGVYDAREHCANALPAVLSRSSKMLLMTPWLGWAMGSFSCAYVT